MTDKGKQKKPLRKSKSRAASRVLKQKKPGFVGWRTSDEEEVARRQLRASMEPIQIEPLEPEHPFYGTFRSRSRNGGGAYVVEIRSLLEFNNSCTCPDFQVNGLGTCKHIEAVLYRLRRGKVRLFKNAAAAGSPRIEIHLSGVNDCSGRCVRVAWSKSATGEARDLLLPYFSSDGSLLAEPEIGIAAIRKALKSAPAEVSSQVRVAADIQQWFDSRRRLRNGVKAQKDFQKDLDEGKRTLDFLKLPLYSYQVEGALHLAFGERALLADDMGLGKTVQAVAACELLRRLRRIERVLVVCPVSLKTEWEEQIAKFTDLPALAIWGNRAQRLSLYRQPSFFYLTNYEQILRDLEDINRTLTPDVIILDEAQRIKNWQTKTAKAVKRLSSPSAFVLTGTPLENRIDEIYSILEFLDPQLLGPLFRFNREYYQLDDRGRPTGYKNLNRLRRTIRPLMLRRRKEEVEGQLPRRVVNNYFVSMHPEQSNRYQEYSAQVARLLAVTRKRPLKKEEAERLQRLLACMRMICDTPYILDPECRICPKLHELANVLEDALETEGTKILIFSEWERMLSLVAELAGEMGVEYAWHTGSVPQQERRKEINRFKQSPECRLFLSTDSGSTGLNLQAARMVINLDLPWNPARLEQRIARAWRKHQTHSVQVINLICESSIEHRMLGLLAEKQRLADGVLDGLDDLESMAMPSGRAALLERLEELMQLDFRHAYQQQEKRDKPEKVASTEDPFQTFSDDVVARLAERLLIIESQSAPSGSQSLLVVIDGLREQIEPTLQKTLQCSFAGHPAEPALEIVDKVTFETIQRLIASGHLQPVPGTAKRLYENASVLAPASRPTLRHVEAFKILRRSDRKREMAELLRTNGFLSEALSPLGQAVEISLRALACLQRTTVPDDGTLAEPSIVKHLLTPLGLEDHCRSAISLLNDSINEAREAGSEEVEQIFAETQSLFDKIHETLHQASLAAENSPK